MGSQWKWNPEHNQSERTLEKMGKWIEEEKAQDDDRPEGSTVPQTNIVPWYDSAIPRDAPDNKHIWTHSWTIRITKEVKRIDLNQLTVVKAMIKNMKRSMELYNAEIHLLWISHIPQNLFRENVVFGLDFSMTNDESRKEMMRNTFPGYLYTHHIFYPGHSVEMYKSPIPWEISIDTTRIDIVPDYVIGKLYIKICGSHSDITRMEPERKSEMITMAPLTQQISGITLTRPRKPSTAMLTGYVKRGINSQAKTEKLIKLMDAGVNVEGAALIGKVEDIIKAVPEEALNRHGDADAADIIRESVERALRGKKKKRLL